jgi:uncharacterized membrane protein YfcA
MDHTTGAILLVIFAATLVRSTFGFGEALIAVPLLALILPLRVAAPLAVLLSITIAAVVVVQDWRKIHFRSTAWLLLTTLPGIPIGLALLTSTHQQLVKAMLALLIIAFSGTMLAVSRPPQLHGEDRVWQRFESTLDVAYIQRTYLRSQWMFGSCIRGSTSSGIRRRRPQISRNIASPSRRLARCSLTHWFVFRMRATTASNAMQRLD